jgi:hypothetical protein
MGNAILIVLLVVLSGSAMAEWVKVDNSGSDKTTYVNPSTIHSDGNNVVHE